MTPRPRHGLHVVPDAAASAEPGTIPLRPGPLSLRQESLVLGIGGRLDADTAGRLRMFLSMFTVVGGPRELVLDLSGVRAVDEDGMAPIHEADEAMALREAVLRLVAPSPAVTHHLADPRCARTLRCGPPPGAPWPGPYDGRPDAAVDPDHPPRDEA
ncbi:STAS domain-containing protein [Geodermatophilus sabuli]|uniref:STAS domain-containing protein n=1 Tax=Geodermatophilus sabuli TaxID=1564158 RepID=A0A285EHR9_9ACTN|nr:STAS domain-containing protein [Geodermatophilus sabuli]MBB3083901.1 anti-anti-sigma regulatory factor [Geodermatophilus sabuli]SNX98550.1 STAS domain-containing protein [Geodermatophilus sabuli]